MFVLLLCGFFCLFIWSFVISPELNSSNQEWSCRLAQCNFVLHTGGLKCLSVLDDTRQWCELQMAGERRGGLGTASPTGTHSPMNKQARGYRAGEGLAGGGTRGRASGSG